MNMWTWPRRFGAGQVRIAPGMVVMGNEVWVVTRGETDTLTKGIVIMMSGA